MPELVRAQHQFTVLQHPDRRTAHRGEITRGYQQSFPAILDQMRYAAHARLITGTPLAIAPRIEIGMLSTRTGIEQRSASR